MDLDLFNDKEYSDKEYIGSCLSAAAAKVCSRQRFSIVITSKLSLPLRCRRV